MYTYKKVLQKRAWVSLRSMQAMASKVLLSVKNGEWIPISIQNYFDVNRVYIILLSHIYCRIILSHMQDINSYAKGKYPQFINIQYCKMNKQTAQNKTKPRYRNSKVWKKMFISLQAGQNFPLAGQISLRCGMVSIMFFFIFPSKSQNFMARRSPFCLFFFSPGNTPPEIMCDGNLVWRKGSLFLKSLDKTELQKKIIECSIKCQRYADFLFVITDLLTHNLVQQRIYQHFHFIQQFFFLTLPINLPNYD